MGYSSEILNNRTHGLSGISVGTHLALESLFFNSLLPFDEEREFKKLNIKDYSYHVFNVFTIIRNILNACEEKDKLKILMDKEFPNLLKDEVELINALYTGTTCKPYLFYPDYTEVIKKLNVKKLPTATEPMKQLVNITNTVANLKKRKLIQEDNLPNVGEKKKHLLPKLEGKVLITTHCYVDLFNKLDLYLLESHTGVLKTKNQWNTKYHQVGESDLSNLPFEQSIYYLLGDRNLVVPSKLMLRRKLLEIAKKFNWSPLTTTIKIQTDLMRVPELYRFTSWVRYPYSFT